MDGGMEGQERGDEPWRVNEEACHFENWTATFAFAQTLILRPREVEFETSGSVGTLWRGTLEMKVEEIRAAVHTPLATSAGSSSRQAPLLEE